MTKKLSREIKARLKRKKRRGRYRTVCALLALIVAFATVYSLIIPAVTMETSDPAFQVSSEAVQETTQPLAQEATQQETALDSTSVQAQLQTESESESESVIQTVSDSATEAETASERRYSALTRSSLRAASSNAVYTRLDTTMRLSMYYCDYDPNNTSVTRINGYKRNQIKNGSSSYFTVTDAYTDGTYVYVPVKYFTDVYAEYGYTFNSNDKCPVIYSTSSGYSSGNLKLTDYAEINNNRYVAVKVSGSGANRIAYIYYVALETVGDAITPSSTVINLFDYWSTGRWDDDNHNSSYTELHSGINKDHEFKFGKGMQKADYGDMNFSKGGTDTPSKVTQGIVANTLGDDAFPRLSGDTKLGMTAGNEESFRYLFDPYYECEGKASFPRVGGLLTQNTDGYYYFDSAERAVELDETNDKIVEYTTPGVSYSSSGTTKGQFFPFNDAHQTALLSATTSPVNHYFGMSMTARFIQQYGGHTSSSKKDAVTFDFIGDNDVWIFIDGVLVADLGGLRSAASVEINFATGDVTINDVGANGKATGTPNTTIKKAYTDAGKGDSSEWNGNTFADGTMHTMKFYYLERGNYDSNLRLKYNLSQVPPSSVYKIDQYGDTVEGARFAVYKADENYNYLGVAQGSSYSTQDVRGFNVDKDTGVIKDSNNNKVIEPVFCDVTVDGELVFCDNDKMPYSMVEIEELFGSHFILREIDVPKGYRTVSDDILLRIEGGVILCSNTYNSGVFAKDNVLVTATNTLYVAREFASTAQKLGLSSQDITSSSGNYKLYDIDYYDPETDVENGTLFAVVLKRNTRDFWHGYGYNFWYPVYGNDLNGYHLVRDGVPDEPQTEEEWSKLTYDNVPGTNISAVIQAAKAQDALNKKSTTPKKDALVFSESGHGMQLLMNNLPGKIQRYYSWLSANNRLEDLKDSTTDPQYVVSYYWTQANSLDGADVDNTVRVYSHDDVAPGVYGMQLQWGTTISVPNMENRLFVQKRNEQKELRDGAVFAMYDVGEDSDGNLFYYEKNSDNIHIYLNEDNNCNNKGTATVKILNNDGTVKETVSNLLYQVNDDVLSVDKTNGAITDSGGLGVIVIMDSETKNELYYITPSKNADGESLVGATHAQCPIVNEEGTAHFTKLLMESRGSDGNGTYVVREIWAPAGLQINTAETKVLVNNTGVYANAGTKDNGIAVGNGVGYLTKTLYAFGSLGEIDETLSWIYIALLINNNDSFSAFEKVAGDVLVLNEDMIKNGWSFAKKLESDTTAGIASGKAYNRSQAMVSYLVFSELYGGEKNTIFNYIQNSDQNARTFGGQTSVSSAYETENGENVLRLFTNYGWSDAAAYQDYLYGITQPEVGTRVNYDDLTAYGNISNLFSSSTFVSVTDNSRTDVDLRLSKLSDKDNLPLADAQFVLWRYGIAQDGEDAEKKYYYCENYDDSLSAVSWISQDDLSSLGSVTLTTPDSGLLKFRRLEEGVYYLTETRSPNGYYPINHPVKITVLNLTAAVEPGKGDIVTLSGDAEYIQTVAVTDIAGVPLPETGGEGVYMYIIGGIVIMMTAVLIFCIRIKLKKS